MVTLRALSALHCALLYNRESVVMLLLKNKQIDVNLEDCFGRTALDEADQNLNIRSVQLLSPITYSIKA